MRRYLQVVIFCVVLGFITSLLAGPVDDLVVYINQSAGVDAGMALVLDDRDGQLTAAMTQSNRLTVQGCTWDASTVQPSRQVVQAAGVGDRATIVLLETNRLPYVENLINLVVSASWGRQSLDIADVLFVLAPGGIGVIGHDGNPLAISGLSNTLSQAGVTDITALSREGWLKFSKPANTNMGTWTHNLAGADLSAVSGDKIAGPWSEIRWVGDPRWGSFYLTYLGRVTEGGRLYYQEKRSIKDGKHQIWIVGRDAWNGAELWRFTNGNPVTNAFPSYWDGTLCCDSQQVYFTEDKVLVARDGRTGAKVRNYATGFVANMATSVGSVLLAGGTDISPLNNAKVYYSRLAALDKGTGAILWTRTGAMFPPSEGGVAFVLNTNTVLNMEAIVVATGATLWKTNIPPAPGNPQVYCKGGVVYVHKTEIVATIATQTQLVVVDALTGAVLWERVTPGGLFGTAPQQDAIWLVSKSSNNAVALDSRTGSLVQEWPFTKYASHCYPMTASARYLFQNSCASLNFATGQELEQRIVRTPCFFGYVPANGLLYCLPNHCNCGITLRGFLAMAPGSSRTWPTNDGPVLVTSGVVPTNPPAELATDWPIYRKDITRSNFTPGALPTQLTPLWSQKLGDSKLSQAVSAYGCVYATEPKSHRVFARNMGTGEAVWSFIADGRVEYPPALYKGLCFISTGAGTVYALNAVTGEEVWRLRAAPTEKYIAEEGQFASAWPVIGGVMPMNGDLYFTCGRSQGVDGGIWIFKVNATNGAVRWKAKGGISGDYFLGDGTNLYLTTEFYGTNTGAKIMTQPKAGRILRTTAYLSSVSLADYMACVEPLLTTKSHNNLLDGRARGENLAFSPTLSVAAWRNRFQIDQQFSKAELASYNWGANQRFIYANDGTSNIWVQDDDIQQMMGVILSGNTAYMAGVPDPMDPMEQSELRVLSGTSGETMQILSITNRPVYDGLSAAGGRLFLTTEDGMLLSFGEPPDQPPSVIGLTTNVTVLEGDPATFTVSAAGTVPLLYQWQTGGSDIINATNAVYQTGATTLADNGRTFRVVVSNVPGCVTSEVATLTVVAGEAPAITVQPTNVTVDTGAKAIFSVTATGLSLNYQWQTNDVDIAGATRTAYTSGVVVASDNNKQYRVVITNRFGGVTSEVAILTANVVNVAPVVNAGVAQTIAFPAVATVRGVATDDGLPTGELSTLWNQVDGPGTATFDDFSAATTTVSFTTSGAYTLRLVASDTILSSTDTVSITVLVNQAPTVNAGVDQVVRLPLTATMAASVGDDGLPSGMTNIAWSQVSGQGVVTFTPNANVQNPVVTFPTNDTFVLQLVADDGALSATDTVTITVNAALSSGIKQVAYDGSGDYTTISSAVAAASSGDIIRVIKSPHTEAGIKVNKSGLIIEGLGPTNTIVQAHTNVDSASERVFYITNATCTLRNMTIRHGKLTGTFATGYGGGIYVNAANMTVVISNCVVSSNRTTGSPNAGGGGISSAGSGLSLVICDSTISDNEAVASGGGVYSMSGTMSITNTTITRNTCGANGGGVYGPNTLSAPTLINCTVYSNMAKGVSSQGGGLYLSASGNSTSTLFNCTIVSNVAPGTGAMGGGLYNSNAKLMISGTIIAGNLAAAATNGFDFRQSDINGSTYYYGNCNLIGITNGGAKTLPATGSYVGTFATPLDPKLSPLANNGGPTMTCALQSDSVAIDHGTNTAGLVTDQRGSGYARVVGAAADIGAYEYGATPPQVNEAPTVEAGTNQTITWPTTSVVLAGTVMDDGLPNGVTNAQWSVVSGPVGVVFGNSNDVDTTVSFVTGGVYVLRLVVSDTALSATDTVTITVYGVDGAGIPDSWKVECFGSVDATNSGASDDYDKDGMNNYNEYRCGTHPTNELSVFKLSGLSAGTPSNLVLRWLSITGITYMIEGSTNLGEGFPMRLETNIPAAIGGVNVRTVDVQNAKSSFYRLGVE